MLSYQDICPAALQQEVQALAAKSAWTLPQNDGKVLQQKGLPTAWGLKCANTLEHGQHIIAAAIAEELKMSLAPCFLYADEFKKEENVHFWFENKVTSSPTLLYLCHGPSVDETILQHFYTIFKQGYYYTHTGQKQTLPPLVVLVVFQEENVYQTFLKIWPDFIKTFLLPPVDAALIEREIKAAFPPLANEPEVLALLTELADSPTKLEQLNARLDLYLKLHQIQLDRLEDSFAFITDFLESCSKTQGGLLPEELLVLKTIGDKKNEWALSLTSKDNGDCVAAAIHSLEVSGFLFEKKKQSSNKSLPLDEWCKALQDSLFSKLTPKGLACLRTEFPAQFSVQGGKK